MKRIFYIILFVYAFIALFASLIANEKPLYVCIYGRSFFPAFSSDVYLDPVFGNTEKKIRADNVDWKNLNASTIIFPLVCWSPERSDLSNILVSPFDEQKYMRGDSAFTLPFRYRHFLGTGKTGNDVLAALIHGTRTSVSIGLISILIALIVGIFFGGIAGYFGDDKIKVKRGGVILSVLMIIPAWFYGFYLRSELIVNSFQSSFLAGMLQIILGIIIFCLIALWSYFISFGNNIFLNKRNFIRADSIISKVIEIFLSLPRLILIITLAAVCKPSIVNIILIIGLTSWTEVARIVRAQVLQLRELSFIDAARSMGLKTGKIIVNHVLPNIRSQLIIILVYGTAGAILVETGLSFLGIGAPQGTATWGGIMYEGRENFSSWWLVLFPGVMLFILLLALNKVVNKSSVSRSLSGSHQSSVRDA